jgi:hypothetical protein
VCLHIYHECKKSKAAPDCVALRKELLNPERHVERFGQIVGWNKAKCGKSWLAGYQGYGCKPGKNTRTVLKIKDRLIKP